MTDWRVDELDITIFWLQDIDPTNKDYDYVQLWWSVTDASHTRIANNATTIRLPAAWIFA